MSSDQVEEIIIDSSGECSDESSKEDYDATLDFFSDKFDPLAALTKENVKVPVPDAKAMDNLNSYESAKNRRTASRAQEHHECEKPGNSKSDRKDLNRISNKRDRDCSRDNDSDKDSNYSSRGRSSHSSSGRRRERNSSIDRKSERNLSGSRKFEPNSSIENRLERDSRGNTRSESNSSRGRERQRKDSSYPDRNRDSSYPDRKSYNDKREKDPRDNAGCSRNRNFLPHQLPVSRPRRQKETTDLFSKMKTAVGPLEMLKKSVEKKLKVKVWTRNSRTLRGYCTGYVTAFDKHLNLALSDITEVWTRKKKRDTCLLEADANKIFKARRKIEPPPIKVLKRTRKKEVVMRKVDQYVLRGEHVVTINIIPEKSLNETSK